MRLFVVGLVVVLGTIALAARGPGNLQVTFYTQPAGALLFTGEPATERSWGSTPITLRYNVREEFKKGVACTDLEGARVEWPSGATATMTSLRACPKDGGKQQFTFNRPNGVPGLDVDMQFALQLEQLTLLRNMNEQARRARSAQIWNDFGRALGRRLGGAQSGLNCTSNVLGSYIYTNCQ
jgi:hypothetical protein